MEVVTRNSGKAHATWFRELNGGDNDSVDNVAPRGMPTREIVGATTVLTQPQEVVPFVRGRKLNYFGMLMESMWILSRVESVDILELWNSELGKFADNSFRENMYGAYGPRLFNSGTGEKGQSQIEAILGTIQEDPDTRRAVATIYQPRDAGHPTRDLPCNTQVMFKLRDNCLNVSVINRSNDLHLGLFGVNAPQFYFLGTFVARWLSSLVDGRPDIYVETQRHYSDSLHLYLDSEPQKSINRRMQENLEDPYFDFYYYFRAPLRPGIVPIDTNPTDSDYVGRNLERIRSTAVLFNTKSKYEATIWGLLQLYLDFKSHGNRIMAINDLDNFVAEWLRKSEDDAIESLDGIAWDWIAGAYYTLAAWGDQSQRKYRANKAVEEFERFFSKYGIKENNSLDSNEFLVEFERFMVDG